ncbi:unnamed protein product [Spodoptera littoralis]|uniref:PDZ domain-containing protein n=1 Tax=Spodoptera littoralis TaxID=7109 RepID=A0A9P0N4K5_SPOLI|nr:unnamed protein product [Spodoptera littoralis]CAH1644612.1 unnamed protein product [Spodoptera littoralis]
MRPVRGAARAGRRRRRRATAATADYIIQDVSDPMILQPASLDTVTLRQAGKPLGFDVVPSFCGHHQLADIRFGSPAHASGAVHNGDEIVQVGAAVVVGWSGAAVLRQCARAGALLALRLRRRAALQAALGPAMRPALAARRLLRPAPAPPAPAPAPSSSDESEALSPPASPTALQTEHPRMYPPKPRAVVQRRHTISGDSSLYKRPSHTIEQFWQELKQQRWGREGGSISMSPAPDEAALYARDKAVSCSTGLELSPRPRTCLGVVLDRARPPHGPPPVPSGPGLAPQGPGLAPSGPQPSDESAVSDRNRGKLDKSHSTPAYDFDASLDEPGPLAAQTIPESPTTPTDSPLALHATDKADRILDFKKSSSQIGEAIQRGRRSNADERSVPAEPDPHAEDDMFAGDRDEAATERILETINIAMMEHRRRTERAGTETDSYRPQPAPRPAPPPRPAALGAAGGAGAKPGGRAPPQFPVLRAVPRPEDPPTSPLKPIRPVDATHISVPLRHITKHDIRIIPSERHEMPAINSPVSEPVAMGLGSPGAGPAGSLRRRSPGPPGAGTGDIVMGAHVNTDSSSGKGHALSPTSAVRGIFPNSKSRSLKKKSSILASEYSIWSTMVAGCM